MEGDVDAVEECIADGTDLNAADCDGDTALIIAASRGLITISVTVLNDGANVTLKQAGGFTALHLTAFDGHFDVC